ncbi:hypothetical protein AB0442_38895 [Kitasatospora sp. NPDC085895]|uniref:hypothetical protein n=1 Tax=Kitasatospora sp. NPDC085895 TaxID=3155057 RepID=UPI00344C9642
MAHSSSVAAVPSSGEVLRARYAGRLPSSLSDLRGPVDGRVELPIHVAWSGLRSYDLADSRLRMSFYRQVLGEGQQADVVALLNRGLLISQWPVLRNLVSRHVRQVWEDTFPELATHGSAAA